jgi:quercetin dioxygenase-like cupin family protein
MESIDRRSALSLGLVGALAPLLASTGSVRAQALGDWVPNYSPTDGEDIGGGRRVVTIGEQESQIDAYSKIQIVDVVVQPGGGDSPDDPPMDMDMICFIIAGSFRIQKEGLEPYEVHAGDYYSCGIGKKDMATNIGDTVGIHRIALLVPA